MNPNNQQPMSPNQGQPMQPGQQPVQGQAPQQYQQYPQQAPMQPYKESKSQKVMREGSMLMSFLAMFTSIAVMITGMMGGSSTPTPPVAKK